MRAPFCNESAELCPEDQGIIQSEDESEREIHAIERSFERSQSSKTAVFGICLDNLMGNNTQVVPRIPFILSRLCRYIETHGLHRKNLFGEPEEKCIVENLKIEFIECGDASLETVNDIASVSRLLLIFFEELPEPLIPKSVQPELMNMESFSISSEECADHLKMTVRKLSDSAYEVLKYLSRFLLRLSFHQEFNGMTCDNLAIIFGPILFRSSSKNPLDLLTIKDVVTCFVQDYHAIFEDEETHANPSTKSSAKNIRQATSAFMPVAQMSPLSVFIPSMDDATPANNAMVKKNVPALLIERHVDALSSDSTKNSDGSKCRKDNLVTAVNRKRKERRLSGEDSQQRSSSEERPNPSASVPLNKMELIRRCNSHEEVMEDVKITGEMDMFQKNVTDESNTSHRVDSYLSDSMELVVNEKNHSPHPPNAKRREVDTSESSPSEASDNWKFNSLSRFSEFRIPVSRSDRSFQRDSKQNPIAQSAEKNTMECDAVEDEDLESSNEFQGSKMAGIPRSASCPVPKADNEGTSESESSSLSLSWSMLFEDSEPVRSEEPLSWSYSKSVQNDALLSPSVEKLRNNNFYEAPLSPSAYRSYLSHRSSHLDASVPPSPPVEQEDFAKKLVESSGVSESIKQLTKKIHNIKRRLRKLDDKFEVEFGYKPSHAEKSNNPDAKKMLSDLYKARKELKALKEEAHLEHISSPSSSWLSSQCGHILGDSTNNQITKEIPKDKSKPSVEDSFGLTLKTLANERKSSHRPELVEDMSTEEVKDEKLALQKALLNFESLHSKPFSKEERNTIRPLYNRYRNVKKLLVRSGSFQAPVSKAKEVCSELQPILEHETMDFPKRDTTAFKEAVKPKEEEKEEEIKEPECKSVEESSSEAPVTADDRKPVSNSCFLNTKYDNSNFHELPLSEMIFQMQKVRSEKRHLRKILKEFETEFLRLNGRKVQKEDKAPVDILYGEYKHVKARLKLLEALISKHDQHQLM